jgi:hypothetical protein
MNITKEQVKKLKILYAEAQLDYETLKDEAIVHSKNVKHTEELCHLLGGLQCAIDAADSAELHDRIIGVLENVFEILSIQIDENEIEELKQHI